MHAKSVVKVAVRDMIAYSLRSGDLTGGYSLSSRAQEGIAGHQAVRRSRPEGYQREVAVEYYLTGECVDLAISGRVDGLYRDGKKIVVEEIKTTGQSLAGIEREHSPQYWAQLRCYAYLCSLRENVEQVELCLTYYQPETKAEQSFRESCTREELGADFLTLARAYLKREEERADWQARRDTSIRGLAFPYGAYRPGQRDLSAAVYRAIRDGRKVFAQAPTGTGKTVAVLFPAFKAMGEGLTEKLFYLTAKTTTRMVAEATLQDLRQAGLCCRAVTLTAKDKICLAGASPCRPVECGYAIGYFDRVGDAVRAILPMEVWTRPVIEAVAREYRVCPFEFSLELAEWADCVIGDYNYAFDPRVYLRRFFAEGPSSFVLLIDEAHNLIDRAREMFSAELTKQPVLALKQAARERVPALAKGLNRLNTVLIKYRKECTEAGEPVVRSEPPAEVFPLLADLIRTIEAVYPREEVSPFREALLDFYFTARSFVRVGETYDERFVSCRKQTGSDLSVHLLCLDPSHLLREAMQRGRAGVLFSATLQPMDYHLRLLGSDSDSVRLHLPSPFPRENLLLAVDDRTATRYSQREQTYDRVAAMAAAVVQGKPGNYLVFFPSYRYLEEVLVRFVALAPEVRVLRQTGGMSEAEREEYLGEFVAGNQESLAGFAVMGGIFGEGIDLVGERLSGAIIVGVGLPQVSLEREIIRRHFTAGSEDGFAFAYTYPGMVRVLQAAGRVIRSETDRGVVLLVDDRFATYPYRKLYPPEWLPVLRVGDPAQLASRLAAFWGETGTERAQPE